LFSGINEGDLERLLRCLSAVSTVYEKNDFIFLAGEAVSSVGLVLSGSVNVIKEDFWGSRSIIAKLHSGELFAESFSCAKVKAIPVSVVAAEKCEVMLIKYPGIVRTCVSSCQFHNTLIQNMLNITASKNIKLTQKIEYMTKKTTKEKLLAYLSARALEAGGSSFDIPFNRQELADYLSVDRSAMSNVLCKMRDEGLLKFNKNHFELKK
jgi:CRP-like cAMP-binding protein